MKKTLLACAIYLAFTQSVFAAIKSEIVTYKQGRTTLTGYLAYDDASTEKRPGIIVVHEWWGHNEYARHRADMLAELGYVAFAIDMYGDGKVADHPDQASAFMQEALKDAALSNARFNAGLEILKNFRLTDTAKLGAIGYCFGGGRVINAALTGNELAGVVSFHGSLVLPQEMPKPDTVKTKILICHGGDDQFATAEAVANFKKSLDDIKAPYTFKVYAGAKHGFTNPDADTYAKNFGMPIAYNADADKQSWQDMQDFFTGLFQK